MLGRTFQAIVLPAASAGAFTGLSLAPSLGAALACTVGLAAFAVGEWIAFGVLWLVGSRRDRSTVV